MKKYFAELFGSYVYLTTFMLATTFAILTNNLVIVGLLPLMLGLSYGLTSYFFAGTSGGHLTPIVSIPMAFTKKISFESLAYYLIAQIVGALGAVVTAVAVTKQFSADFKLSMAASGQTTQQTATTDTNTVIGAFHRTLATTNHYLTSSQFIITAMALLVVTVVITKLCSANNFKRILTTTMTLTLVGFVIMSTTASLDILNPAQMLVSYLMTDMHHPVEMYAYMLGSCLFIALLAFCTAWLTNDHQKDIPKY